MYPNFIHFNPDPVFFTLPFLDFQMRWYTLWTILGISGSYLVALFVLKDKLLFLEKFSKKNIKDWSYLLSKLGQSEQVLFYFSSTEASKIKKWKGPDVSDNLKKTILERFKKLTQDPDFYSEEKFIEMKFSLTTKMSLRNFKKIKSKENIKSLNTHLLKEIFTKKSIHSFLALSNNLTRDLVNYIVIFNIIGARLAHVFFYDWSYYQNHLGEILMVWKGGLASHGGVLGTLFGVFLFFHLQLRKIYPKFTLIGFFDLTAVYIGTSLGSIRLGNLFNQEILGKRSDLPWAIVFPRPENGAGIYPRHPVQLYESFSYYFCFLVLLLLWKRNYTKWKEGTYLGIGLIIMCALRFICEFYKESISEVISKSSSILMGQYLSLPFIFVGIIMLIRIKLLERKK